MARIPQQQQPLKFATVAAVARPLRRLEPEDPPINLYVGNLPFNLTSEELTAHFSKVGPVTSAQVINDRETGRSRGFGFVEMSDEDGRRAIDELSGQNLAGRALTVNEARPRQPRR